MFRSTARLFDGVFIRFLLALAVTLPLSAAAQEHAEESLGAGMENPGFEQTPEWFKVSFLDLREDLREAREEGRGLMLYFYQDGCPYCKRLLEENFGDPAIAAYTREHFDVVALNMWGDREVSDLNGTVRSEKAFAQFARVMFTPTLILIDGDGKVALRINGYFPKPKFHAALEYVADGHHRKGKFRAWLAARSAAPTPATARVVPGAMAPPYELAAREGGKPLVVLFEQGACDACDELHRDGVSRPEVREELARFDVLSLDMWSDTPLVTPEGARRTAEGWARELSIHYAPSLVMFDAEGREVFRTEAYLRPFHLRNALGYVASGAYREQPSFQRYIEGVADAMRERGEAVELMR